MLEQIRENTILKIKELECKVISKVCYFTENKPNDNYFKIKCDNGKILIISEDLADIMVGEEIDIKDMVDFPAPNKLVYNNSTFNLVTSDYQFVKYIEFGNFGDYEPECRFMDYINDEETETLSIGIDTYNNKRDDVFAEIISLNDIQVMN